MQEISKHCYNPEQKPTMNNVWTSFKLMNNHTKCDIVSNSLENIIVRALWWQRGRTSAAHYTKTLVCVSPTCRPRTPQLCQTSWLHSRRQSSLAALQPGKRSDRAHTWKKREDTERLVCSFYFTKKKKQFFPSSGAYWWIGREGAALFLHINIFLLNIHVFPRIQCPRFTQISFIVGKHDTHHQPVQLPISSRNHCWGITARGLPRSII